MPLGVWHLYLFPLTLLYDDLFILNPLSCLFCLVVVVLVVVKTRLLMGLIQGDENKKAKLGDSYNRTDKKYRE
jgi:hypothetical protein